jgi:carbon-monoxide dehydrogenase medium subunit
VTAHRFDLELPRSLDEALDCVARHGSGGRALAGGTVLLPELAGLRVAPSAVIDLSRVGLDGIRVDADGVSIGAATTYRQLASAAAGTPDGAIAWLGAVAGGITGGAQIRNRGTVGGSAAFANPSSDVPAVLVALGAVLTLASAGGSREVRAEDFFTEAFRTCLHDDELLVVIAVPDPPAGTRFGYEKLKFGESSWPIVTAAAIIRSDSTRVALGGCSSVPVVVEVDRAADAEEAVASAVTEPWSDVLANGAYRRRVAPVVARRAIERAA